MAQCSRCNAETELYCNGTPLCPSCDSASRRDVQQKLFLNDRQPENDRPLPNLASSER